MKYAAFFRNLNFGRQSCPTKVQFEEAFAVAGATSVSSFLTNGTMIFTGASNSQARKILAGASVTLRGVCGLQEPAYIRTVEYLKELVAFKTFAAVEPDTVFECCVSFLHLSASKLAEVPSESKRGDVRVLRFTGTEVLSVSLKVSNTPDSPNAFLERFLGSPVTTRSWRTVVRLAQRYS